MPLPSLESVEALLRSGEALRDRITAIAKRLELIGEYSPEQALIVAADIVRSKAGSATDFTFTIQQPTGVTL